MTDTSTLSFPTHRFHAHTRPQLSDSSVAVREKRNGPALTTLTRLRQFARAYCPVPISNQSLTGIMMN